eukprot:6498417-Pyramimonas_sp.AAC.1
MQPPKFAGPTLLPLLASPSPSMRHWPPRWPPHSPTHGRQRGGFSTRWSPWFTKPHVDGLNLA